MASIFLRVKLFFSCSKIIVFVSKFNVFQWQIYFFSSAKIFLFFYKIILFECKFISAIAANLLFFQRQYYFKNICKISYNFQQIFGGKLILFCKRMNFLWMDKTPSHYIGWRMNSLETNKTPLLNLSKILFFWVRNICCCFFFITFWQ